MSKRFAITDDEEWGRIVGEEYGVISRKRKVVVIDQNGTRRLWRKDRVHIMPECEVCGNMALHVVNDTEIVNRFGMRQYRIHSTHFFCDEHKRESINIREITDRFPPEG